MESPVLAVPELFVGGHVVGVDVDLVRACEAVTDGRELRRLVWAGECEGSVAVLAGPAVVLPELLRAVAPGADPRVVPLDLGWTGWGLRTPDETARLVETWRSWEQRYRQFPDFLAGEAHPDVVSWIDENLGRRRRVLSLGDGNGRHARALAAAGHDVVAIDLCPPGEPLPSSVTRVTGDALRWADTLGESDRFDLVLSVHARLPGREEGLLAARLARHLGADAELLEVATTSVADAELIAGEWPRLAVEVQEFDGILHARGRRDE